LIPGVPGMALIGRRTVIHEFLEGRSLAAIEDGEGCRFARHGLQADHIGAERDQEHDAYRYDSDQQLSHDASRRRGRLTASFQGSFDPLAAVAHLLDGLLDCGA
jgi:hypothetical protein